MNIEIIVSDNGQVLERSDSYNFESATEQLGKMERRWSKPVVQRNVLDGVREHQLEGAEGKYSNTRLDPLLHDLPQADEEEMTEEEYDRQEMDSHLHKI